MVWSVIFHDSFVAEFQALSEDVQDELLAHSKLLSAFGPHLGRPTVDTIKGSKYCNMKELRFRLGNGVWRIAFAFDPNRQAILLAGGNKVGAGQTFFYRRLIRLADDRYQSYLKSQGSS